ncbi:MAG TPA: amidohydrolase [Lachnoclostridium phytofermentans]|uniref:Amidohydrolase n=1 Tax=Lachnoclostridium phytofermentans TaxID=66219 RepID=A0A3D2X5Z0_9FIRM|nr:amidohydrolase [Lachnoclostridium sp.]HCL01975.1 amidohydrolase [Lachnoclostridium phytofermentans]
MKLLIKNGIILTMSGTMYQPGDLLIEDGKIKKIAPTITISEEDSLITIPAANCIVMPGFIEAHCHVGIAEEKKGKEGDDSNETSDPVTPYLRAIDAINPLDPAFHDAIRTGITGIMVGPGSTNVVGGQFAFLKTAGSRCVEDLAILNPAAMKVAFGENPKSFYGEQAMMPFTRMGIAFLLREELWNAKQYLKKKKKAEETLEEFEEDFRLEPWIPVLEKKIPLKAHVHRTDDILTAIRIAKEFDLTMTLDHCTEGHLISEEILASGFPAIVGPDLTSRNKIETQNMGFKTAGELSKAGVMVSITTDHPVSLIQSLPICTGLAVKNGLPMEEGLKALTINAAKICRVDDRIGSLEVGKDADIAIFDGNPLEVFTNCLYTIIDGKIVYQYHKPE